MLLLYNSLDPSTSGDKGSHESCHVQGKRVTCGQRSPFLLTRQPLSEALVWQRDITGVTVYPRPHVWNLLTNIGTFISHTTMAVSFRFQVIASAVQSFVKMTLLKLVSCLTIIS